MARQGLKERGVNRVAVLVYSGGTVLLAPWIVVLALSQEQSTDGYRLRLSSLGMSVFIVAALVRAAITCRRQSPGVVVPASLAATFLFISGWFDTITAKHAPLAIALAYDVFVKLPTIVLAVWLALRMARDRGAHHSVPAWVPTAFVAATIVLVPWFVTVLRLIQRTSELHNLRLFWTGLDIFELVSMAATGWYLYRRSPYAAVSAMVTAALLLSDAWFNVVTTVHLAHRAALVMALVELPLAIYSVVIAGREVRSWPTAGAPNSSLCAETAMQHLRSIAAPNGGSRSLLESRVVTLRSRLAVIQCVRLTGQEWQRDPINYPAMTRSRTARPDRASLRRLTSAGNRRDAGYFRFGGARTPAVPAIDVPLGECPHGRTRVPLRPRRRL